jgi:hypothetical protein
MQILNLGGNMVTKKRAVPKGSKKKLAPKKVVKTKPAVTFIYEEQDEVLPALYLPSPCPISVSVSEKRITLQVGPRDWCWDRKTQKLTGAGLAVDQNATEIKQDNAAGEEYSRGKRVDASGMEVDEVEEQIVENSFENTGD